MKHNPDSKRLRKSIVATFIDLAIAATISISSMASAQSVNLNREVDFSVSSPDPLQHLYDAGRYSKSSMPKHQSDIIESRKWDYEWSSSSPIEFTEGLMVRPSSVQPVRFQRLHPVNCLISTGTFVVFCDAHHIQARGNLKPSDHFHRLRGVYSPRAWDDSGPSYACWPI